MLRTPDGTEHGFHGEYREIVAPERIVYTENYEPIGPGHEMITTASLEEHAGRTTLRNRLLYQSREDRDGHLSAGMEGGVRESHDRLAAVIASLM